VKHLSQSLKLQDREHSVEQMEAEELEDFIRLSREDMHRTEDVEDSDTDG
jgi:hypothetical protein